MQANTHNGLVADCPGPECDGRLIEEHRTWLGDRIHAGLLCPDCDHSATVEWAQGDDPLDAGETSEPLTGLDVREIQWIACPTCHGAGTVEEWGIRSGRHSCPDCHRSGVVPRLPVADGGRSVDGAYRAECVCGWSIERDKQASNLSEESNERIARAVADIHETRPRIGDSADETHAVSLSRGDQK